MYFRITSVYVAMRRGRLITIIIEGLIASILISCGNGKTLREAESLLETNPKAADSLLSAMPIPQSRRDRAWYAVLKTQAEYKQRKTFTSDSLIITATDYYGTSKKGTKARRYQSALAWYSQGCVYSELNNDYAAIDAYLKAKDLFPDTLIRYYALAEQKLGTHYLDRIMLDQSKKQFMSCKINAERLGDTKMYNYAFVRLGLCALYGRDFITSDSIFTFILNSNSFSNSHKTLAKLQKSKINLYNDRKYNDALLFVDSYINDMKQPSNPGTGYSVKADIYYEMNKYDSAYHYYKESMKYDIELYTRCSNADRLAELATLFDDDESLLWHKLYGELRDSINNVERTREIEELQYQHKEIMIKEKYAHRHRIILIICSSFLLFLIILYFIQRDRNRKKYYIELSDQYRIRKIGLKPGSSESEILDYCLQKFYSTPSFDFLKEESCIITGNMRQSILHDLTVSFSEYYSFARINYPAFNTKYINFCILHYLNFSHQQVIEILCLSENNYRVSKSRIRKIIDSSNILYPK